MSSMFYKLDENHKPIPCSAAELGDPAFRDKSRIVQQDKIGKVRLSTVFLCIDHSFDSLGNGPPVLWETMIFGGPRDQEQHRYTSHADALAGHLKILAELKKAR